MIFKRGGTREEYLVHVQFYALFHNTIFLSKLDDEEEEKVEERGQLDKKIKPPEASRKANEGLLHPLLHPIRKINFWPISRKRSR